jgi:hypothetical protein
LKKTMKKTSVTPSATFDRMPRPNHTAKIGARITRGIAFIALMYGSASAEAVGDSASHSPIASPSTLPIGECEQRLDERDAKVRIDLPAREPFPYNLQNLDRLAEEERGVLRKLLRDDTGCRQRVPDDEQRAKQQQMVNAEAGSGVTRAGFAHSP